MTMLPVTYGYARVSKADDDTRNLDTQLRLLAGHGIREDLIFTDVASGRSLARSGWQGLMSRIQAELTQRNIGIVALRENIDSREGSAASKFFQRSMLAQGAYQVDSARSGSSWAWTGPEPKAVAWGARRRCLPTRSGSAAGWPRKGPTAADRRAFRCSPATVKRVLEGG